MWQRLLKVANAIGRFRISLGPAKVTMSVGSPHVDDAQGLPVWRKYMVPERLYRVWGPLSGSAWENYHCVPLFTALDTVPKDRIGPSPHDIARSLEGEHQLSDELIREPLKKSWADSRTWVILDLPGAKSVALAVRFIRAGFQPVCTFDHWPHPAGLLKPELILGQLLRYASTVEELRSQLNAGAPPLWICDYDRLGVRRGTPNEFDNRYFLDDSILPSRAILLGNDVQRIICVLPQNGVRPREDLCAYFRDLQREGFGAIYGAYLDDPQLEPVEFAKGIFEVPFSTSGYHRSNAGGFGQLIPEPGSSGG